MDEQQQYTANGQQIASNNYGYQSATALQMRLETDNQLEKIRQFLSGKQVHTLQDSQTGDIKLQETILGDALMNAEGVNHVTNYISAIINPQVVQGNYDLAWYQEQLFHTHRRLAFILTTNRPKWEIEPTARYSIIGFLMEFIKPFLSRLIENKERESYATTMKMVESSTMQTQGNSILGKVGVN